ncbi:MAG: hypothetical protein ACRDHL_15330 [Candidatus Promineifilaceae bacterium]
MWVPGAARLGSERLALGRTAVYVAATVGLLALFGLKDALVLLGREWPHLTAVVNNPVLSWEEVFVYLPLANHFSLATPLPAAPMADPGLSQLTSLPPLTLILQGALYRWLSLGNPDAYLLAMHALAPTAAFWLLFLIYRRYVAEAWSFLLAFWGVTFFRNFSSLGYWFELLGGRGGPVELASLAPPELTRTPAPALTFLLFILAFHLSTREHKPSLKETLAYSALWAAQAYIYLFNFVAGILFWFIYLAFTCYWRDRTLRPGRVGRTLALNAAVVLAVISPLLLDQLLFRSPLQEEVTQRMGMISAAAGPISSEWGFLLAYVLPLAVVLTVAWAGSADYYELVYRFGPVLLMIGVELLVLNLHLVLGRFFQPYLFSIRIGAYFSRYLYFIPVLYFLSRPPKRRFHRTGRLSRLVGPAYAAVSGWLARGRRPIALVGVSLIALVAVASSMRFAQNHAARVAPRMIQTEAQFNVLVGAAPAGDALMASEEIEVNLLLPARSRHETLLVSSFNNFVPESEILERLLLFAHVFNWDEARFLAFMLPNPTYDGFYSRNDFVLSPESLSNGFGYWLLNHQRQMNAAETAAYAAMLAERFATFDVAMAAAQYNLRLVQASRPINPLLPVAEAIPAGDTSLYRLEYGE